MSHNLNDTRGLMGVLANSSDELHRASMTIARWALTQDDPAVACREMLEACGLAPYPRKRVRG